MSNVTLRCSLVFVLQAVLWKYGRTEVCYRQEVSVRKIRSCGYWWLSRSNCYFVYRNSYHTVKVCCEGWIGEYCEIPIYEFPTPAPVCSELEESDIPTRNTTDVTPPASIPIIGDVTFGINQTKQTVRNKDYQTTSVYFLCNFHHSSDADLLYRVTWYENGCKMLVSGFGESQNDTTLLLTETQFIRNGFSLGNMLSCDVKAFTNKNGPSGIPSNRSKELFVGIELLTRVLVFEAGDTGIIQFRPTIPIGCYAVEFCELTVKTVIPDEETHGTCSGIAIEGRRCGIKLLSKNPLDTVYNLRVKTAENGQYQTKDGYYEIFLEVDAGLENKIWRNYKLPTIHVHIQRNEGSTVYGKRCHSDNDPHMRTFDGVRYELQDTNAIYTLYEHAAYDAEIQIRLKRCNSDRALCNCGIAARAGQDIYKIDLCESDIYFRYMTCGDNAMKVKSNGEWKYKIFMPYGTYAEVDIQRLWGDIFLGIRVQPSYEDSGGKSAGLCGTLDNNSGNDFQLRKGTAAGVPFTRSWIVTDEGKNMFSEQFQKTELAPLSFQVCVCRNITIAEIGDSRLHDISCKSNAVAACIKGKDTSAANCAPMTRFRRSLHRNPYIPKVRVDYLYYERTKRQAPNRVWETEEAENFCRQYITKSSAYEKCTDVPNVRTQEDIDNCALDLVLTQEPGWANISMEAMQSTCLSELERNTTLRHSDDPNVPSIADQIEKIACVNNCSMAGNCIDGACHCKDGYGGSDCSFHSNEPPVIGGVLDNGFCDEREFSCSHAYIFGHFFVDSVNLTCKLFEFELTLEGYKSQLTANVVKAQFDTFIEVICPLESVRRKRSVPDDRQTFVYGYTIHVSNDGVLYGDGKDIYIYNSECQQPTENGDTAFVLMEGFCFINGQCYSDGDFNTYDDCSVCSPGNNKLGWSTDNNQKECSRTEESVQSKGIRYVWVIGVILPTVVVAFVLMLYCVHRYKMRVGKVVDAQVIDVTVRHADAANVKFAVCLLELQKQQTYCNVQESAHCSDMLD